MIDPNEKVTYNGEPLAIKDIPDIAVRRQLGLGHFPEPGRGVVQNQTGEPWRYTPDDCPRADEWKWTWINNATSLVCPGCGTDGT